MTSIYVHTFPSFLFHSQLLIDFYFVWIPRHTHVSALALPAYPSTRPLHTQTQPSFRLDRLYFVPISLPAMHASPQGNQFDKVAKLIKVGTEDLEMERAGIITQLGGFDTHNDGNT